MIAASYFYVYFISMTWFVFWRCWETGDLVAAMIVFSLGTSSEIGTTKLLFMIIYRKKIRKIVEQYLYYDSLVQPDSRFGKNIMKQLRHVKKRAMIFWIVIIGNGVLYISIAILTPGRHLPEDIFTLYGLEPSTQSPNYEISFLLMTGGTFFTVYLPANITAFLIIITGYTEAQMLALSEELLNIWSDALDHHSDQTTSISETDNQSECIPCKAKNIFHSNHNKHINEYIKVELRKIVQRHVANINLLHQIENIFRGAIAVEFMLLIVGLLAELLGGLENTYVEVPYALMQVAMDCLTGQRLIDASMTFEAAVYACKWENFDVKNVKTIYLMLLNSQKTMKLSAGGITVLNFCSLMMIFRSIYSAYTTLGSILG